MREYNQNIDPSMHNFMKNFLMRKVGAGGGGLEGAKYEHAILEWPLRQSTKFLFENTLLLYLFEGKNEKQNL